MKINLVLVLIALFALSCSKIEVHDEFPSNIDVDYLQFASVDNFTTTISKINKQGRENIILSDIIGTDDLKMPVKNFRSIVDNKLVLLNRDASNARLNTDELISLAEDSLDELVPDIAFATLLNEKLEIQVENIFYKITPHGTFFCDASLTNKLKEIVGQNYEPMHEMMIDDYLYQVEPGIFRYDTYGEADENSVSVDELDQVDYSNARLSTSPCGYVQPDGTSGYFLSEEEYCSLKTYSFGAKTIVGKFIASIFGVNSYIKENFDSKHRVKVKFYNYNYVLYSSIGVKTKFQKKGWTGIWVKDETERLSAGWDAIVFEVPIPNMPKPPYSGFPTKGVAKAIYQFANFSVEADVITRLDNRIFNLPPEKDIFDNGDLSNALNNLSSNTLANLVKKTWNYAEKSLSYSQYAARREATKSWEQIYPSKIVIVMSRWEKSKNNEDVIDCNFDWNTIRLTYKGSLYGDIKLIDDFAKPSFTNRAKSYKVKKASIYGAAKYKGQLKGVRIVED